MNLRPRFLQERRVPRDQSFGPLHIPIRDSSDDLCDLVSRKIDLHDGTSLRDMNVGWRMIERVDPDLEPLLAKERWH